MVDHSRRVSPRENVDAIKALVRRGARAIASWTQSHPLRRFLRRRNVLTLLGFAGVVLSVAALTMLIDVGKAQVVAAEYPGQHRANLFDNWWCWVAFAAAVLGLGLAAIAISANNSQATARRAFPNLSVIPYSWAAPDEVPLGRTVLVPAPGRTLEEAKQEAKLRLVAYGLLITNHEPDRRANLTFRLRHDIAPPAGYLEGVDEYFFSVADRDLPAAVPAFADRLDDIVRLDPQDSTHGEVVFDISPPVGDLIRWDQEAEIVVADLVSRTHKSFAVNRGGIRGT
jgi:hypothetical protein